MQALLLVVLRPKKLALKVLLLKQLRLLQRVEIRIILLLQLRKY
jgi:hypothetical protein